MAAGSLDGDSGAVVASARQVAYDDYLADLLAPSGVRDSLMTLAAYFGDVARIPLAVSEPALGEIRLQFWRDTIVGGVRSGHPIGDALTAAMARHDWPHEWLLAPLEARAAELYADPLEDRAVFETYLDDATTSFLKLRAVCLGAEPADQRIARMGQALGLTRFLVRVPVLLSKGRFPVDQALLTGASVESGLSPDTQRHFQSAYTALLDEAGQRVRAAAPVLTDLSPTLRVALLPFALSEPYLQVLQSPGHDGLRDIAEPSPLRKLVRLWWVRRTGWF